MLGCNRTRSDTIGLYWITMQTVLLLSPLFSIVSCISVLGMRAIRWQRGTTDTRKSTIVYRHKGDNGSRDNDSKNRKNYDESRHNQKNDAIREHKDEINGKYTKNTIRKTSRQASRRTTSRVLLDTMRLLMYRNNEERNEKRNEERDEERNEERRT